MPLHLLLVQKTGITLVEKESWEHAGFKISLEPMQDNSPNVTNTKHNKLGNVYTPRTYSCFVNYFAIIYADKYR